MSGLRELRILVIVGLLLLGAGTAPADEPKPGTPKGETSATAPAVSAESAAHPAGEGHGEAEHEHGGHHEQPSDLYACDFFRTGWGERFEERPSEGRAPRFKLFKSRQGFLERIAFGAYAYTNGLDAGNVNEHELAAGLEWAFNRRFEFDVEPFYTWQRPSTEEGRHADGLRWDFGTRFQLLDTADRAYNFQIHVVTPNRHLDADQTALGFALAGFEDLTNTLGLHRVGLYHDVEYVAFLGPREAGDERRAANELRYDVSLAKTLVEGNVPLVADLTVFVEAFGQTELDGSHSGRSTFSFTPGFRFNPTGREEKAWWIQAGIEFPVTGPLPFNERVFVAVIHDF
ncbi:MAG TPA: hypothetical protein VKE94_10010 [Gemmataceae bacterium]|nr:hypothetical protein [Gemmataceae bacterium]